MMAVAPRRAQAALEFLTTYGWAFLVILVMIGAITYFGISNPTMFIPERCNFGPDILCDDFQVYDNGVVIMELRQTFGRTYYLYDLACETREGTDSSVGYYHKGGYSKTELEDQTTPMRVAFESGGSIREWQPRDSKLIKCVFPSNPFNGLAGEMVSIPIALSVRRDPDGFNHVIDGDINAKVANTPD